MFTSRALRVRTGVASRQCFDPRSILSRSHGTRPVPVSYAVSAKFVSTQQDSSFYQNDQKRYFVTSETAGTRHGRVRNRSTLSLDENVPSTGSETKPGTAMNPLPKFDQVAIAYNSKTMGELSRAALSFGLCKIPFLVRHADTLLSTSRNILGDRITDSLLRMSLFGHFCAGVDEQDIKPTIQKLHEAGIGSILDFAAEDDNVESSSPSSTPASSSVAEMSNLPDVMTKEERITDEITGDAIPQARMYDYESESQCDAHVETFRQCIQSAANLDEEGFAAVKVTALSNPMLLTRMSQAIVEARKLFQKFDANGDGFVSYDEFKQGYNTFFDGDNVRLEEMMTQLFDLENETDSNAIDYISWSMLLSPRDLPQITAACRENGPLKVATPTDEEIELIEKMYERGHALAKEASATGTRLLIDAEHTHVQPAIDALVLDLQRTYNAVDQTDFPIIYNTYQCYLKDATERLETDMKRSNRFGYHFGAKLVRGAYMESERALAETLKYPSPIHDTIEDTHESYDRAVKLLLTEAARNKLDKDAKSVVELTLATHNQESVENAIKVMNDLGIDRHDMTISFAQLFGMKDNLTFNLGKKGFRAYKYVPYGEIKMVMPYLIRRAKENSSIAGGASAELEMVLKEMWRRVTRRPKS